MQIHMVRLVILAGIFSWGPSCDAQSLDELLRATPIDELVQQSQQHGDAVRGAIVFFQPGLQCSRCHTVSGNRTGGVGPDLAALPKETTDEQLVQSVLEPSRVIRKGYESGTALLMDGRTITGIIESQTDDAITLRDASRAGELVSVPRADLEEFRASAVSIMPAGQVNQLSSRQQFLDLIRYLQEVRDGGPSRARELQPAASLLTLVIPEYEKQIDHAGFIRDWNDESLQRGEAIYRRVCMNCHGTKDEAGSLPTSLKFATGKFRNGSDPHSLYQTLTRGFGLMAAQTWMVPSQKYDVIHYIREEYLRESNPTQYTDVNEGYLAKLPAGTTRGPEPSRIQPWNAMDYGPSLAHTYEVPGPIHNIAFKGFAVRLDSGAGGISRGRHWMMFDTDTMRMAAAWSASDQQDPEQNFIDWRGIQFNGEHQIHPRITGQTLASNGTGPGWANPANGKFNDSERVLGRDGRRYGPLPSAWGKFHGHYVHGQDVILSYSIGATQILERPHMELAGPEEAKQPVFLRSLELAPSSETLILKVAERPNGQFLAVHEDQTAVVYGDPAQNESSASAAVRFDGQTYCELAANDSFDLVSEDFTITADVRTTEGGTLVAVTERGQRWVPNGQTLFIRDGHLCFDIGWAGVVSSETQINDGKWHRVAVVSNREEKEITLWIDGQVDGSGQLSARKALTDAVVRLGFTSPNFPEPNPFLLGDLRDVRFFQRALTPDQLAKGMPTDGALMPVAHWNPMSAADGHVEDQTGHGHSATVIRGQATQNEETMLHAGFLCSETSVRPVWSCENEVLVLTIPPRADRIRITLWMTSVPEKLPAADAVRQHPPISDPFADLLAMTHGGPSRWNQKIVTQLQVLADSGSFVSESLTAPESNPWLAQMRLTGLDFLRDGRIVTCTWDGDVWIVEGPTEHGQVSWKRIASGLFQPLGLRIINDVVYLTCRDQLAVLRDLNGDEEADFVECFNNDHQVTEHFHEFAMGLQTDAEGNFYYAKSGRHALEAVVPHHGTLLKVSPDGARTTIIANGFRAANGVCLNPDGSFVVTDQEGFWNPKNRINWVTLRDDGRPRFYGNMFGYHDVTDTSDAAMEPPLCWITNAFDRSPGELLRVDSEKWGSLNGQLLNLSYGYGKVFLVPFEQVDGQMQGGMIELPIPAFPTGVMRGRFRPADGELYLCGMFAWAGSATQPGGLYRLRRTEQPVHLPAELHASVGTLTLKFTEPLSPESVTASEFEVKAWDLKRSARYGSDHLNERSLTVREAKLRSDGTTVSLEIPELQPTWCMEIRYCVRSKDGKSVCGTIHNTIHHLAKPPQ